MSKKEQKSILSAIKDLITIMILLSILVIISVFGYRFITNKKIIACQNTTREDKMGENIVTTQTQQSKKAVEKTDTNQSKAPSQKLYTQEEVQELMDMLVEQMNELHSKNASTAGSSTNSSTNADSDNLELARTLKNLAADTLEENSDIATQNLSDATAQENKKVDTYNKVVVDNTTEVNQQTKDLQQLVDSMNIDDGSRYTEAIKPEIKTRESEMRVIIVKKGDTLSKIAKRAYGSAQMYDKIYEANPDLIKDPNRIYIGQRLRVPTI